MSIFEDRPFIPKAEPKPALKDRAKVGILDLKLISYLFYYLHNNNNNTCCILDSIK